MLPFRLTKKNQKGQVAIFVALIFQIIFIFFAILINVGLLVHHKINLQQSTDLAAYYGAMKQAEILNVIGHVNFQIRQAWKLLTWRYRVLGTFGYTRAGPMSPEIGFPILLRQNGNPPASMTGTFNQDSEGITCNGISGSGGTALPLNYPVTVFPVFCSAHSGIGGWTNIDAETFCKLDCAKLATGIGQQINKIPSTGQFSVNVGGTGYASSIGLAGLTQNTNNNVMEKCSNTGAFSTVLLSRFLSSYTQDLKARRELIKTLAVNLSDSADNMKDIEGNNVKKGAENTFNNNLTEANFSASDKKVEFLNGLDHDSCRSNGTYDAASQTNYKNGFLNEIVFQFLQFYMMTCSHGGDPALYERSTFEIGTLLTTDFKEFNSALLNKIQKIVTSQTDKDNLKNLIENSFHEKFSVGFEKNPWCASYFAVRAKSSPKIPFLPLAKIQLSATAIAKPFGGTVGPWYGTTWKSGSDTSDNSPRVDENLPKRDIGNGAAINTLGDSLGILMNYSNYVGDNVSNGGGGLADAKYIANYHDMLLNKEFSQNFLISSSTSPKLENSSTTRQKLLNRPTAWPDLKNWIYASKDMLSDNTYDSIAASDDNGTARNNGLRDIEISVVAPNQFDLSYYSIDADFYNNYYKKLEKGLPKINGSFKLKYLRPDYGFNNDIASSQSIPKDYGVKDQINVAANIVKKNAPKIPDVPASFKFTPDALASLLTGWTFINLTDQRGYTDFPLAATGRTTPFGKCVGKEEDQINQNYESLSKGDQRPPTPGNCVTGGRTGYSVKIVSPDAINGLQGEIGGVGTSGTILNPIPQRFLDFQ